VSTRSPIGKVLVALATLVVAGATAIAAVLAAEPAAAGATCVAVVVDFRQLGGAVQTGCAQGDPSNGLSALSRAGFSFAPRPRDGLICQIDAHPACTDTTSATYWSYWYRAPGSSRWVYASEGAGTHDPKPGSTEAWVWQNGGRTPPPGIRAETICPQLATTSSSTPKPTHPLPSTKPSTTPAPTRSTQRPRTATPTPSGRHTIDPPDSSATSSPTSRSPGQLSATQPPPTDGSSAAAAAGPNDPTDRSGGTAIGGVAGAALGGIVVLGIGAATVMRARRGRPS